jgi:hypothetical protein
MTRDFAPAQIFTMRILASQNYSHLIPFRRVAAAQTFNEGLPSNVFL